MSTWDHNIAFGLSMLSLSIRRFLVYDFKNEFHPHYIALNFV